MPRRSIAVALASTLAVLAGAAGLTLAPDDPPPDTGRVPRSTDSAEVATPTTPPPPPSVGAAGADPAPQGTARADVATPTAPPAPSPPPTSRIGIRSGRLEDLPAAGPAPVGVRIEAAGVAAAVVPVGVEPGSQALAVPDDVAVAGWYRFGPAPGDPGSAVLTAHVDSANQGLGAFFPLRDVAPGAAVTVTFDDGSSRAFEVVGRRSYSKDALPVAELFARDGEPLLTLVTCGGPFDRATRSYEENLVVYAVPAGPG